LRREALLAHRRRLRHLRVAMFAAAILVAVCIVVVVMAHT
jgi:predicted nucleic acid-binding Zn ribbon protein